MSPGPPPVPGGRTPEEREAARREREARRAGRTATVPPPPPPRAAPPPAATPPSADGDGHVPKAARPRRARPPRRPGTRRRTLLGLVLVGGVLAALALWLVFSVFQPFSGDGEGNVQVVIPKGASVGEIGDLLERKGVIESSAFFSLRARVAGRGNMLKPGTYTLKRDMSYVAALDALEKGLPPNVVRITVPEGRARTEIARSVDGSLRGSYVRASRRSRVLRPARYGAPASASLEGFLFPSTYELKKGRPASSLVDLQLRTFKQQFAKVDTSYARKRNLSAYDVLIIASMVEREAQVASERPVIASVIYNRLREGMPLGIDATVRFATGNWTRPLRQSELASPSPYNTRVRSGLPPGPIGNPGLSSMQAAARPARTKYLFYVVKPGGNGSHAFSETDAEFQRDVDRYNTERERRGGRSPASP